MVQRLVHWNVDSPEFERQEKFQPCLHCSIKRKGIIKNPFVEEL